MSLHLNHHFSSTEIAAIKLTTEDMRKRTGYPPNEMDVIEHMTKNPNSQFAQVVVANMAISQQDSIKEEHMMELYNMQTHMKQELRKAHKEMHDDSPVYDLEVSDVPMPTNNEDYNHLLEEQQQFDADLEALQDEINSIQSESNAHRAAMEAALKNGDHDIQEILQEKTAAIMKQLNPNAGTIDPDQRQFINDLMERAAQGKSGGFMRVKSDLLNSGKFKEITGEEYDPENSKHVDQLNELASIEYKEIIQGNPAFLAKEANAIEIALRTAPEPKPGQTITEPDDTIKDDNTRDKLEKQEAKVETNPLLAQIRQGINLKPVTDTLMDGRAQVFERADEMNQDLREHRQALEKLEVRQDSIEEKMNTLRENRENLQNKIQDKREDYANLKLDKLEAQQELKQNQEAQAQRYQDIRPTPGR